VRWFFAILYGVTAILFVAFVAWIATRITHEDAANYVISKILVYDLYAIGVVMLYVAFVGAWHTWERLTGRMELERHGSGMSGRSGAEPPDRRD
jgi:hypothetical protein